MCFSIIKNAVKEFLVRVPISSTSENHSSYDTNSQLQPTQAIDVYLQPVQSTQIDVEIVNGSPFIKIHCSFNGKIHSMNHEADYLNEHVLQELSFAVEQFLASSIKQYLYKTSLQFNADINGLGKEVASQFLTTQDLENFHWLDNYKNSVFQVEVSANVGSGFLLTETK